MFYAVALPQEGKSYIQRLLFASVNSSGEATLPLADTTRIELNVMSHLTVVRLARLIVTLLTRCTVQFKQ
eukprot:4012-Heterococcus_DN1.PRE.1